MNLCFCGIIINCLLIISSARKAHSKHHHNGQITAINHKKNSEENRQKNESNDYNDSNHVLIMRRASGDDKYALVLMRLRHANKRHVKELPTISESIIATPTTILKIGQSIERTSSSECENSYVNRITEHCRYPGMNQPCFAQPSDELSTTAREEFIGAVTKSVQEMAHSCCEDGRRCSTQEFEKLCCRTPACLARCYGANFYTNRKQIGGTLSAAMSKTQNNNFNCAESHESARPRSKSRRNKSHFRFLDILARPNPARQRQRHFENDENVE